MGAILNGMSLSKVRPFGSGFLIFSDYAAAGDPAGGDHGDSRHPRLHARLDRRRRGRADAPAGRAARLPAGDPRPDRASGPATPTRWSRPGGSIMQLQHEPAVLILTRQALPTLDRTKYAPAAGRGARAPTSWPTPPDGKPDVILLATGSEVALCVEAHETAQRRGHQGPRGQHAVAGSSSSTSRRSTASSVLPPAVTARVAVEQAVDVRLGAATSDRPGHIIGMHDLRGLGAARRTCRRSSASRREAVGRWRADRSRRAADRYASLLGSTSTRQHSAPPRAVCDKRRLSGDRAWPPGWLFSLLAHPCRSLLEVLSCTTSRPARRIIVLGSAPELDGRRRFPRGIADLHIQVSLLSPDGGGQHEMAAVVPPDDHGLFPLVSEDADRGRRKRQQPSISRIETQPAGGEHPQEVAVAEQDGLSSRHPRLLDQPMPARRRRTRALRRVPRRATLSVRHLAADLGGASSLVVAVVPLRRSSLTRASPPVRRGGRSHAPWRAGW